MNLDILFCCTPCTNDKCDKKISEKILIKAETENKLIAVDCLADKCGGFEYDEHKEVA